MKTDDIVYFGGVVTDTGYVTTAGGPWCRVARVRSTETVASDIEVFQGATREGTLVRKAIRIGSPTAVYRRSEEDFIVEDDVYRALARFRYVGGVWLLVCELPGLNLCATPNDLWLSIPVQQSMALPKPPPAELDPGVTPKDYLDLLKYAEAGKDLPPEEATRSLAQAAYNLYTKLERESFEADPGFGPTFLLKYPEKAGLRTYDAHDAMYPQHVNRLREDHRTLLNKPAPRRALAERAKALQADREGEKTHPRVLAHWEILADPTKELPK